MSHRGAGRHDGILAIVNDRPTVFQVNVKLLIHPDARSPEDTKACLVELLALPFESEMAEWYQ